MSKVNLSVALAFQGAGVTGTRARLGGEGVGRTRDVGMENVLPCSEKGEAASMETTSHFRMLPMSSWTGVYRRPLPTCSARAHSEIYAAEEACKQRGT